MFTLLGITYIFIILIVLFGDYKEKEINKHKKDWERLIGNKYE